MHNCLAADYPISYILTIAIIHFHIIASVIRALRMFPQFDSLAIEHCSITSRFQEYLWIYLILNSPAVDAQDIHI
jgi:hypothetical protein